MIVVEQANNVFSYKSNAGSIMALIILVIIGGVLVFVLVRAIKAKNNGGGNANPSGNNYQNTTDNW